MHNFEEVLQGKIRMKFHRYIRLGIIVRVNELFVDELFVSTECSRMEFNSKTEANLLSDSILTDNDSQMRLGASRRTTCAIDRRIEAFI